MGRPKLPDNEKVEMFVRNNSVYSCHVEIFSDPNKFNEHYFKGYFRKYLIFSKLMEDIINVMHDFLITKKGNPHQVNEGVEQPEKFDFLFAAIRHHHKLNKKDFPQFINPIRKSWSVRADSGIPDKYFELTAFMKEHKHDLNLPSFNSYVANAVTMLFVKIYGNFLGITTESLNSTELKVQEHSDGINIIKVFNHSDAYITYPEKHKDEESQNITSSQSSVFILNINTLMDVFIKEPAIREIVSELYFSPDSKVLLSDQLDMHHQENAEEYIFHRNIISETLSRLLALTTGRYLKRRLVSFKKLIFDCGNFKHPDKIHVLDLRMRSPLSLTVAYNYKEYGVDNNRLKVLAEDFFGMPVNVIADYQHSTLYDNG
ncbi:hypothetical protein Dacet_0658 [Denitrovibrio acetiphilus DSM 12809]|uniref:Uncharacterized protein n=1 Tax=Denitrovibrio acetiphilus (strain DSM 12809 / NBRC 114555 / N2460) TaxID=522772 RepID=D4H4Q2_DENA2|nr:hypothetical protein [Denitrovibrio acetiphilus]ADD67446.1 hypothetical protein Dacet_0658 [Denitrovibrio acetiphilus DSM 12809]